VELSPETCRVKPLRRINAIVTSCWNYFTIPRRCLEARTSRSANCSWQLVASALFLRRPRFSTQNIFLFYEDSVFVDSLLHKIVLLYGTIFASTATCL